jgi:hypothetical protein
VLASSTCPDFAQGDAMSAHMRIVRRLMAVFHGRWSSNMPRVHKLTMQSNGRTSTPPSFADTAERCVVATERCFQVVEHHA